LLFVVGSVAAVGVGLYYVASLTPPTPKQVAFSKATEQAGPPVTRQESRPPAPVATSRSEPIRPPDNPPRTVPPRVVKDDPAPTAPPVNVPPPPPPPAPAIKPGDNTVVRQLPAPLDDVVVGGGGRYLILRMPGKHQVAVFDAYLAKVVKYLPFADDNTRIAAGMDKLLVMLPNSGVLQRWSLTTLEREVTAQAPVRPPGVAFSFVMGSASNGPLLLGGTFVDVATLKTLPIKLPQQADLTGGIDARIRASADGKTFTAWATQVSPQGIRIFTLIGDELKYVYQHDTAGALVPGPDGRVIYTTQKGLLSSQATPIGNSERDGRGACIPAEQGPYYLAVRLLNRFRPDQNKSDGLTLYIEGDDRPIAELPDFKFSPDEADGWGRANLTIDKRVHLIPGANVIVRIPPSNDRLELHPFDVDAALKKTDVNYLIVTSQPPLAAKRGEAYTYQLKVKSKRGGVKYRLDAGPKGMKVGDDGTLTWKVPADAEDADTDVIVTAVDSGGQEAFQTFKLTLLPGDQPVVQADNPPKPEPKPEEKPAEPAAPAKGVEAALDNGLKPPALDKDKVVRALPSTVGAVCEGGGGRFLILSLPKERKLAVFDASAGLVVRYLPLAADGAQFAAGMDKLLVAYPGKGVIQRYDLHSGEREVTANLPTKGTVAGLCMGSASDGPLLVISTDNQPWSNNNAFLDPTTLKPLDVKFGANARTPGFTPQLTRASPDGRVWTTRDGVGGEPHTVHCYVLSRDQATTYEAWIAPSLLVPGPDGQRLYTAAGVYNEQLKPVFPKNQNPQAAMLAGGPFLPAAQGDVFLQLLPAAGNSPIPIPIPGQERKGEGGVAFFLPGEETPFTKLENVEGVAPEGINYGGSADAINHDRRVHYIPAANLLVALPVTNDRLILYRFDLDKELKKATADYLFVASQPPRHAKKGDTYRYQVEVKSKKGGVKYQLSSGPDGMKVSDTGLVTWKVTADWADFENDVIVNVSDQSGKEAFHSFKITVAGASGEAHVADQPANPAAAAKPDKEMGKPAAGGDKAVALGKDPVVRPLPAPLADLAVGGGGRYLIASLPQPRQLAIFDATEAKVVKLLPVGESEPKFAAGMDKLLVLLPDKGILLRYDLKTREREVSVPLPVKGQVNAFAMGSASQGPLLVGVGEGAVFLDVRTLKPLPVRWSDAPGISPTDRVRASADGRTFGVWRTASDPAGLKTIVLTGRHAKLSYQHTGVGHVLPGPDGKVIYTALGRYTAEGKPLQQNPQEGGYCLPAAAGHYYLQLSPGEQGATPGQGARPTTVTVQLEGDTRPLVTLKDIDVGDLNPWDREPFPVDRRVHFLPQYKLLVTLPQSNDRLVVRRLDVEEALEKSGVDYLLVTSEPPTSVKPGEALEYQVTVKSKRGRARYKLESGPKGMTVAKDGKLTWKVPADFKEKEADVILSIGDASGQEIFHNFTLTVEGKPVAEAPAEAEKPAAGRWKEYTHPEGCFSARLPAEPKNTSKKGMDGMTGGMVAEAPDGVRYEVQFNDLPKGGLAAGPKFILDAVIKQLGDNVKSQKEAKLGDDKGIELSVAVGEAAMTMRLFIVKERMYQLIVSAPKGKGNPADAAEFLDSFKLTTGSAAAPGKEAEVLAAADLTKAFADDEAAAKKKYGGLKALVVEGVVKETHVDKDGGASLLLKGHDDDHGVVCNTFAARDNKAVLDTVKEGQTVRVKGWGYGKQGEDVLLGNCQLVK
jgi:hypothetical protein